MLCLFLGLELILQHYMLNGSINEQLVEAADVKEGDVVLEIGPGTGSLTNVLLNAGATVLAIEKVHSFLSYFYLKFCVSFEIEPNGLPCTLIRTLIWQHLLLNDLLILIE